MIHFVLHRFIIFVSFMIFIREEKQVEKLKKLKDYNFENVFDTKKKTLEDVLNKYEKYLKEGTVLKMSFPAETTKSKLYCIDDGVRVYLSRRKKVKTNDIPFTPVRSGVRRGIGSQFDVVVEEVDWEGEFVKVKETANYSDKREQLIDALKEGIEKKECVRIPATVIGFTGVNKKTKVKDDSVVLLDIANFGIAGAIPRREWTTTTMKCLKHSVRVGDTVEVAVTGIYDWTSGKVFYCSRKKILEADGINPWEGIEKKFPKRTRLIVTPIELKDNYFFATVENLQDIELLCYYPTSETGLNGVELGEKYIASISSVSEENHKFCARIMGKFEEEI